MALTRMQRGLALSATIIASSMGFIDGTIVHIALPTIQKDLGAPFASLQWIANSYLLTLCALLVISGAIGDRYGPRRIFMVGIVVFTLSSALCAASGSSELLIVARTIQGIGAALMLPQSLSIIARLYEPKDRGKAVGIWSAASSASAAAGPVIGGFLVDNGGWPFAFWVNLPLGLLAFLLTLKAVPKGHDRKSVPLDWPGSALLAGGLGALVFGIINLSLYSVSSIWVWPACALGVVGLIVFVMWEKRAPAPVLPAHFLKNREFVLLNAYCLTIFSAFAALMFLIPYMLITSLGLSASMAALNVVPLGICISLLARPVGGWADRIGYRTPMLYGAVGVACTTVLACSVVWLRTPWAGAVVMTSLGLSAGLMVTPLTTGVLNSVATQESGLASGINHAVTRVGNLLAIALFGALLAVRYRQRFNTGLSDVVSDKNELATVLAEVNRNANDLAQADLSMLPETLQTPVRTSMTSALDYAFVEVMLGVSLCAVIAVFCAAQLSVQSRLHKDD